MQRNPKEDYVDKTTQWEPVTIGNVLFEYFLDDALDEINVYFFNNKTYLDYYPQSDGSFIIKELWKYPQFTISYIRLAIKLQENNLLTIYIKLKNSNKWIVEELIDLKIATQNRIYVGGLIIHHLLRIISEHFPSFYNEELFPEFEELQTLGRQRYEIYQSLKKQAKKNPKKTTKATKKFPRRL